MTKTALIRCGPIANAAILNSDAAKRPLYDRMRLLPNGCPIVIDHDENNVIGEVIQIFQAEDTLPVKGARWLMARCRLNDNAPAWIAKGSPASISHIPISTSQLNGFEITRDAVMCELTICSARHSPVEPLASVIVIQDEPAPLLVEPPPMTQRTSAQREVDELRRRLDQAGPYADIGLIIEALRHELGYRTTLTA